MAERPNAPVLKTGAHPGSQVQILPAALFAPALPLEVVFDPTGAGDTFAGGFIGYLAATDDTSFENMKRAIIAGSALASFCVEKFGTQRLLEISRADIDARIEELVALTNFEMTLA